MKCTGCNHGSFNSLIELANHIVDNKDSHKQSAVIWAIAYINRKSNNKKTTLQTHDFITETGICKRCGKPIIGDNDSEVCQC